MTARSETLATRDRGDKSSSGSCIKNKNISNEESSEELHKSIIRKLQKGKVYLFITYNTWGTDLAEILLISKFNKGIHFLLCVIDIFNRYTLVIPFKERKGITITNAFEKTLDESNRKPNKIWVNKGSKLYNRSINSWLEKNAIKCIQHVMKENLSLLKDLLNILQNKIYKYKTSILKKCIH